MDVKRKFTADELNEIKTYGFLSVTPERVKEVRASIVKGINKKAASRKISLDEVFEILVGDPKLQELDDKDLRNALADRDIYVDFGEVRWLIARLNKIIEGSKKKADYDDEGSPIEGDNDPGTLARELINQGISKDDVAEELMREFSLNSYEAEDIVFDEASKLDEPIVGDPMSSIEQLAEKKEASIDSEVSALGKDFKTWVLKYHRVPWHTLGDEKLREVIEEYKSSKNKKASLTKTCYFISAPGDKRPLEEIKEEAIADLSEEINDPKIGEEIKAAIESIKNAKDAEEIEGIFEAVMSGSDVEASRIPYPDTEEKFVEEALSRPDLAWESFRDHIGYFVARPDLAKKLVEVMKQDKTGRYYDLYKKHILPEIKDVEASEKKADYPCRCCAGCLNYRGGSPSIEVPISNCLVWRDVIKEGVDRKELISWVSDINSPNTCPLFKMPPTEGEEEVQKESAAPNMNNLAKYLVETFVEGAKEDGKDFISKEEVLDFIKEEAEQQHLDEKQFKAIVLKTFKQQGIKLASKKEADICHCCDNCSSLTNYMGQRDCIVKDTVIEAHSYDEYFDWIENPFDENKCSQFEYENDEPDANEMDKESSSYHKVWLHWDEKDIKSSADVPPSDYIATSEEEGEEKAKDEVEEKFGVRPIKVEWDKTEVQKESKKEDKGNSQLEMGMKVELEHKETIHEFRSKTEKGETLSDEAVAKMIAEDHLKEDPEYYTKLMKMEQGGKKKEASNLYDYSFFKLESKNPKGSQDLTESDKSLIERANWEGLIGIENEDLTLAGLIEKAKEWDEVEHGLEPWIYEEMKEDIERAGGKMPEDIRQLDEEGNLKEACSTCKEHNPEKAAAEGDIDSSFQAGDKVVTTQIVENASGLAYEVGTRGYISYMKGEEDIYVIPSGGDEALRVNKNQIKKASVEKVADEVEDRVEKAIDEWVEIAVDNIQGGISEENLSDAFLDNLTDVVEVNATEENKKDWVELRGKEWNVPEVASQIASEREEQMRRILEQRYEPEASKKDASISKEAL